MRLRQRKANKYKRGNKNSSTRLSNLIANPVTTIATANKHIRVLLVHGSHQPYQLRAGLAVK